MSTLKLRHIILFIIALALLMYFQYPFGALILIGIWLQLAILLWKRPLTPKLQKQTFILFLILIPLTLFWGSIALFLEIYVKEFAVTKMALAILLTFVLTFVSLLAYNYSFDELTKDQTWVQHFSGLLNQIKVHKKSLFWVTLMSTLFLSLPIKISADYKILFTIILNHLYLKRENLKELQQF